MISIVDDDAAVRQATEALVRSLGHRAATFSSAEEFLSSDRLHETSCLITDVQMPGMTGIELQRRLTAMGPRCPVIVVTGSPDARPRVRGWGGRRPRQAIQRRDADRLPRRRARRALSGPPPPHT